MASPHGHATVALWRDGLTMPTFPPLPGDLHTQVCVVGAGIAGLTTAYLLARAGRDVVLVEALDVGAGESGRSLGIFYPPDESYARIERHFGLALSRLVAGSFTHALAQVETILRQEQMTCGFERLDGYLAVASRDDSTRLEHECAAATRAGITCDLLDHVPGLAWHGGPCIRFHGQAQFDPLRYMAALAQAFVRMGGRLFGSTHAQRVTGTLRRRQVITNRGRVDAPHVVVATHTPFNDRLVIHTKQSGWRRYVAALRIPQGSIPPLLLWDGANPGHVARLARDAQGDLLLVAGSEHKTGQEHRPPHAPYALLEHWARLHFPMVQQCVRQWSYEIMQPVDGLAYLGRNPLDSDNVFIITGDSGNEMQHATIGAMIIADLILERPNPWDALYDPARKPIHGLAGFASAQAGVLAHYGRWVAPGEVASVAHIREDSGAIVRDGLRRLAVYRDPGGTLHALSARCTHLGCVVHWNPAEHSWDCPCHASRFDIHGQVLHGPAQTALAQATLPPASR